jgi:hypothetical protein
MKRTGIIIGMCALLGACAAAPQSYIDNDRVVERTHLARYRVVVVAIDGQYRTDERRMPVAPGQHLVIFSAPPAGSFSVSVQKTYPVAILPCTEYYFAADRANNLTQDWDLVLEDTRPVGGCNAAEEMKKAGLASNATSFLDSPATLAAR